MRLTTLAGVPLALLAAPAFAQDTAPPPAVTVSGGATLTSDYRFRGISQTEKKPAIQGTFTVAHESGLYGTVWASSIDDYVAAGADEEIDLIVGYKKTIGGTTIDGGVLYYVYPHPGVANTDFFEPYLSVSHSLGPVTAKVTANYAWKQHGIYSGLTGRTRDDNLYLSGDLSAGIPSTPVSVSAHLGHSFGPSYLTIGREYTDWNLGATYVWNRLTFGLSYVDTDHSLRVVDQGGDVKNVSKAGVVASVGVSF